MVGRVMVRLMARAGSCVPRFDRPTRPTPARIAAPEMAAGRRCPPRRGTAPIVLVHDNGSRAHNINQTCRGGALLVRRGRRVPGAPRVRRERLRRAPGEPSCTRYRVWAGWCRLRTSHVRTALLVPWFSGSSTPGRVVGGPDLIRPGLRVAFTSSQPPRTSERASGRAAEGNEGLITIVLTGTI